MKPLFITTLFLLATLSGFAQNQKTYFLKNDGKFVDNRDSADFTRIVKAPDSTSTMYGVTEFYKNGHKKLEAKSTTDIPLNFESDCITYFENGSKESITRFVNNANVGDATYFFPNGRIYKAVKFPAVGDATRNSNDPLIETASDSTGKAMVTAGNGYFKSYNTYLTEVVEQGNIKNGKKDGTWKGIDQWDKLAYTEKYKDGAFINGTSRARFGKSVKYTSLDNLPTFPGGNDDFTKFLAGTIKYPLESSMNGIEGTVLVQFVVEKDGSLSDIKINRSVSPSLDAAALNAIKNSPKWVPGMHRGRLVRVQYIVPVNFILKTAYLQH